MKTLLLYFLAIASTAGFGQVASKQNPTDFLPNGFVVFEKIVGDLNKDGTEDCVLIIKGTDKSQIVADDSRGLLDRNRRGIIVLFNKNGRYELAVKNYECFASENEDGGVYFPPELSVEIKNGNLSIHYGHGRYGFWTHTFRFQNSDFELIGFDSGSKSSFVSDWVTFDEESINFLSKKRLSKEVIEVATDGKETFKESWKNISIDSLIKLSEVKDFDELDMSEY